MKWSMFNTVLPYERYFAIYNSLSQKVIFILPELKKILEKSLTEGIDTLNKYHPSFYDYLKIHEFIVDLECDEVEKVRKISAEIDNDSKNFMLTINPTMNCNFKCWYCYETHIKQSKLNENIILRIQKFIDRTIKENNTIQSFTLSFFGGEPLLYFKDTVVPIIDFAKQVCEKNKVFINVGFTTNGYLINDFILNFFSNRQMSCSFQITLDGYKDDHDKVRYISANKGSYFDIVKNVRKLILNHHFVRLRVNYTNKNIENTYKIIEEFIDIDKEIRKKYLVIDFHRVWQNVNEGDINDMVEKSINLIRNHGFNVLDNSSLNNVVESCYADKRHSVVINYNGDIYKCTARDFIKENRVGYIDEEGILIWENDHLEKRMSIKFKNKPCLSCRILPICGGGCSQHAIENEGIDYCIYGGNEHEKNKIVKSKIDEIVRKYSNPVTIEKS